MVDLPGDGGWTFWVFRVTILGMRGDHPCYGGWPSLGWWVTALRMVGDSSEDGGWPFKVCWVPILVMLGDCARMVGDCRGDGGCPSLCYGGRLSMGWWVTKLSRRWWVTVLEIVGGWLTVLRMVGDCPKDGVWLYSKIINFCRTESKWTNKWGRISPETYWCHQM